MGTNTGIEWTDATWNPIRGCTRVSEGCRNCYAERMAIRQAGPGKPYEGLVRNTPDGPRWTGQVDFVPEKLGDPLKWREPRCVFTASMSDPFHANLSWLHISAMFGVMALTGHHIHQVLTKRPTTARQFFLWLDHKAERAAEIFPDETLNWRRWHILRAAVLRFLGSGGVPSIPSEDPPWPLPNVWLGVSVENQAAADERIPLLLQCPAVVRFISAEPLLGPVNLTEIAPIGNENPKGAIAGDALAGGLWERRGQAERRIRLREGPRIDWVIVGGESGPGARPMHPGWVRSLRDQSQAAGVPFFFKQWGEWLPGQNDPHPLQSWGLAHWQDGKWGARKPPQNPERNYVVWYKDGEVHYGNQAGRLTSDKRPSDISAYAERVGKKRAGALLDGREWREFPRVGVPACAG